MTSTFLSQGLYPSQAMTAPSSHQFSLDQIVPEVPAHMTVPPVLADSTSIAPQYVSPFADIRLIAPDLFHDYQPSASFQDQNDPSPYDLVHQPGPYYGAIPQESWMNDDVLGSMSNSVITDADGVIMDGYDQGTITDGIGLGITMDGFGQDTALPMMDLPPERIDSGTQVVQPSTPWYDGWTDVPTSGTDQPTVPERNGLQGPVDIPLHPQPEEIASRTQQPNSHFFSNLDEAIAAMSPPSWRCPANDITVPTSDEERQQWVLKLLNAVNNIENVHDKQGNVFKNRWFHPLTGASQYYSSADKEILCWDIVDLAEHFHRECFDPTFWHEAAATSDWTFQQRMEKIIELLTYSKGRCEKLLGGIGLQLVVGNPVSLMAMTKENAQQNRKRQSLLQAGRATKKVKTGSGSAERSVVEDAPTVKSVTNRRRG